VLSTLRTGLTDGSIVVPPPESEVFPSLPWELERPFRDERRQEVWDLLPLLPILLRILSRVQALFADITQDLEGLIQLARKLRSTPSRSLAQDISWHVQRIAREFEPGRRWPHLQAVQLERIADAVRLGKMLEIALEEETPIVVELSIQLQLSLAEALRMVLQQAGLYLEAEFADFAQRKRRATGDIEHWLGPAVIRAKNQRISEVVTLIETLQIALKRVQPTMPVPAAVWQPDRQLWLDKKT